MSPTIPFREISSAAVLEVGERLMEAPSRRLTDIAFSRELQAQLGLMRAIGWVDLAHTMTLAERGIIPRESARALIAALLALAKAPSSFAPTGRIRRPIHQPGGMARRTHGCRRLAGCRPGSARGADDGLSSGALRASCSVSARPWPEAAEALNAAVPAAP